MKVLDLFEHGRTAPEAMESIKSTTREKAEEPLFYSSLVTRTRACVLSLLASRSALHQVAQAVIALLQA